MNDHDLPNIAQKAIELVLGYHAGSDKRLTEADKAFVKDRINELLPLKPLADDPDVANIEIVSDAAVSFLDVYNHENSESPLNEKWFYISVQALTCIQLKPALVCGEVARLVAPSAVIAVHAHAGPFADPFADHDEGYQPDEVETRTDIAPNVKDHHMLAVQAPLDDDEPQDEEAADGTYEPTAERARKPRKRRSSGPSVARGKAPWTDEDIRTLIKLKIQGRTHKVVATTLSRTEPACAIRHSIVLKEASWREFAREYRAKWDAGETSDAEAKSEEVQGGEVVRGAEEAIEIEEMTVVEQVKGAHGAKDDAETKEDEDTSGGHE